LEIVHFLQSLKREVNATFDAIRKSQSQTLDDLKKMEINCFETLFPVQNTNNRQSWKPDNPQNKSSH